MGLWAKGAFPVHGSDANLRGTDGLWITLGLLWNCTHGYPQTFCSPSRDRRSRMPGGLGVWRWQYRVKSMDCLNAMAAEGVRLRPRFLVLGVQEAAPAGSKGACAELGQTATAGGRLALPKALCQVPSCGGGGQAVGAPAGPRRVEAVAGDGWDPPKQGWPSPHLLRQTLCFRASW